MQVVATAAGSPDLKTGPAECGLRNFLPNQTRATYRQVSGRGSDGVAADCAKLVLDIALVYIGPRSGIGGQ